MSNVFMKNVKAELKKVIWPTKKQLINNTVKVLFLVAFVAIVVLSFDFILKFLDGKVWDYIKTIR